MTNRLFTFAPSPGGVLTGLFLSVFGTLLTLVGLYLTYRKARLAAPAADAATTAVREFRFRVNFQDASRDISEAAYALDTTRRHLNNEAWRDAIDSYEDARRAFIRIDLALPALAVDHQEAMKESVSP